MNAAIDEFRDADQPTLQDAIDNALRDGAIPAARIPRVRAAVAAFSRLMLRIPAIADSDSDRSRTRFL